MANQSPSRKMELTAGQNFERAEMEGLYLKKRVSWMDYLLMAWLLLFVIGGGIFGLKFARVCGSSMAPTIHEGEIVITISVDDCTKLSRGDVITFHPIANCSVMYIKRIAALPTETIEARNGTIFVDGIEIAFEPDTGTWGPFAVPEGEVFVLGDNQVTSIDSRIFGYVAFQQITSKMIGKISVCRDK